MISERFARKNTLFFLVQWLLVATVIAVLVGSASALFLFSLDWATATRIGHRWLIGLLPFAGFAVGWLYLRFGRSVEAGNNLILEEVHNPANTIPLRMAPLVFIGTVVSHLFGASVGREGTAVQMGASIADRFTPLLNLDNDARRMVLMAGVSAGFSSVFGTPLAGAIFGMEVMAIGRMHYTAIFPCLLAAVIADQVGLMWGVHHTHYAMSLIPPMSLWTLGAVIIAGGCFGLAARAFADATHLIGGIMKKYVAYAPLRPFIGGIMVALAVYLLHADRYIGLGIPTIVDAFQHPLAPWDFLGKLVFTVVSLGSGFKGGEVTPLFYVGATLGNALAPLLHLPFAFLAGLGFVAVFAGAANTPLASTLMAIELFGADVGVYAAMACVMAYLVSGYTGIYRAQRVACLKHQVVPEGIALSELPAWQRKNAREHARTEEAKADS
ncbi:TPA: voltage-gated chloride channel family protein [Kluyvera ascorbata]|uniref:Voltage-gated chloride channel protein n=1 Tax=Kluyvera genomosp. 2 TaxID=2774054 RepID=A0A2T2Y3Q2_9ENTR|nr:MULTISPECIES: voltage-gated chloride channel family protein [Enterobacteriaceae]HAT3918103.1 voltage-gated chloride channel family protein [Kluyvera ascorbata]PSR47166.1 voltage-gated chloride channel protein [Kluyvera genomosp. 2]BBQ82400.1 chloride/fluoride channel protein [Klebsiella sp. WP3-W18-ESBL-02]BBR19439.1 chloride/fluoride channel protein [Klebsiella sp. WP3-S18-ESBL-05]BBT69657.1 chloride/fluoride channel protein [Klebsiella sp. WP8-S18-ESBL-06]